MPDPVYSLILNAISYSKACVRNRYLAQNSILIEFNPNSIKMNKRKINKNFILSEKQFSKFCRLV